MLRVMDARRSFGKRLRMLRTGQQLSQQQLADRADRSVEAISNLERGLSLPGFETLENLSEALGIPIRDLFEPAGEAGSREETLARLLDAARGLPEGDLQVALRQVDALRGRPSGSPDSTSDTSASRRKSG